MSFSFGPSAAPVPSSFSFSTNAPSPSTSLFGATPAPAPSTGFGFSSSLPSSSAPGSFSFQSTAQASAFGAPSTGPAYGATSSAFGTQAPATGTFGFGAAPSTQSAFSFSNAPSPGNAFGASSAGTIAIFGGPQNPMHQHIPAVSISANMQYSDLSPEMKNAIDNIHQAIMRHKRSMNNLQNMAPKLLLPGDSDSSNRKPTADSESHPTKPLVSEKLNRMISQLSGLQSQVESLSSRSHQQKSLDENLVLQSIMYAKWPVEALAHRKGLRLTPIPDIAESPEEKKDDITSKIVDVHNRVRESLDRVMSTVDRIEKIPSPYMWQVIHDLDQRIHRLEEEGRRLQQQIEQSIQLKHDLQLYQNPIVRASEIVESQHQTLWHLASLLDRLRMEMERLRYRYRNFEHGDNVLDKAAIEESERQRKLNEEIQLQIMLAPKITNNPQPSTQAPAATSGSIVPTINNSKFSVGGFGAPSPAPTGFSFSSSAAPTAPSVVPAGGGAFSLVATNSSANTTVGSTTTTAPATAGTGQTAPVFGTTQAAAPTAFGFSSTAPTAKKKTTRSSSRLKR